MMLKTACINKSFFSFLETMLNKSVFVYKNLLLVLRHVWKRSMFVNRLQSIKWNYTKLQLLLFAQVQHSDWKTSIQIETKNLNLKKNTPVAANTVTNSLIKANEKVFFHLEVRGSKFFWELQHSMSINVHWSVLFLIVYWFDVIIVHGYTCFKD